MLPDGGTRSTAGRSGSGGTSKANPAKLQEYAAAGMDMLAVLRSRQQALHAALEALRPHAGSEYVPSLEGIDNQLDRLILDWEHLDAFVGDVGQAFFDAATPSQADELAAGMPITMSNGRLVEHGRIGFADRVEAIEAAETAAAELAELNARVGDYGIEPEELREVYEAIALGQYDPAFAVTFSEALGVEGYVEAMTAIRATYLEDVPEEGMGFAQVLAMTMTTALDTRPGIATADRHDPDNAHLAPDQRLGDAFVDDLVGLELEPTDPIHFEPSSQDLSVLMSMVDPPTDVAVAVADARLTPALENENPWDETAHLKPWGDRGDMVTNYATMLGRNEDASIRWLNHTPHGDTSNLEVVLQRDGEADADGGAALAGVVESGLTHPDRDILRGSLMEQAIGTIGDQGEIRTSHMTEALAAGVDHNMDVVDRVVNDTWRDPQEMEHLDEEPPEGASNVHVFLREVMRDEQAAVVVSGAVEDHLMEQLADLPEQGPDADGDGADDRTEILRDAGTLQGVVVAAEGNVELGSIEDYIARQEAKADGLNFAIGLIPYGGGAIGAANDLLDVGGVSAGEVIFQADVDQLSETQRAILQDSDFNNQILLGLTEHPERIPTEPVADMSQAEREELYRWATSPGIYDGGDHDSLSMATWRAALTFLGDT